MEIISLFEPGWKAGFFILLAFTVTLHLANAAAILQLVTAIESFEGKTIPSSNRWKLITMLPLAALYYHLKFFFQRK